MRYISILFIIPRIILKLLRELRYDWNEGRSFKFIFCNSCESINFAHKAIPKSFHWVVCLIFVRKFVMRNFRQHSLWISKILPLINLYFFAFVRYGCCCLNSFFRQFFCRTFHRLIAFEYFWLEFFAIVHWIGIQLRFDASETYWTDIGICRYLLDSIHAFQSIHLLRYLTCGLGLLKRVCISIMAF